MRRTWLSLPALAAITASTVGVVYAQEIRQPTSGADITSFSGIGQLPFEYSPSDSSVTSVNIVITGAGGGGTSYAIANGLERSSGSSGGSDTISAVFAPTGGWCGDQTLQVYENQGNTTSSSPSASVPITVTCGPIQRRARRQLDKRQGGEQSGPSGSLTTPSGGTSYSSPDDSIDITYQPVTEGGETFGIDASLTSDLGNFTLVNGLWKSNDTDNISARFALPSGACGPFNLVIIEHQLYQNGAISFQAAAPSLNISCPSESGGNTNVTTPTNVTTSALPTSTAANATSTNNSTSISGTATLNSTSTITSSFTSTSTSANATSTITTSNTTTTLVEPTSTSTNATTSSTSITSNSTSTSATSTATNSTSSLPPPTFTGNITLPIETSTITRPTTIVSTVTTTFTESGQTGTVTSVVTTTVSPSSTSTTSNSTTSASTTSGGGGGGSTTSDTTSTTSSTSETSSTTSRQSIRTTTVTATPSSEAGITTVTVTPSTTPTSGSASRVTSTYTTTEVVVVAASGRSSITSTRLQTVILVSQTIAAIVTPSSPTSSLNPGGGATSNLVPLWTTMLVSAITIGLLVNRRFL